MLNPGTRIMRKSKGPLRSAFFEGVYEVVKLIPRGRVTSYGAIAKYLGARRVGYALNQGIGFPDVPAHRVVNQEGMLTGRHHFPDDCPMDVLLQQEGIEIENMRVKHFDRHYWDPARELL